MSKDAYYFSHDCNARNDPKILAMRSVYGMEGYGIYFAIIEMLREQPDYKLHITKYIWDALALQMQCNADLVHKFVDDCCDEFTNGEVGLLINDGECIYSESLLRRMEQTEETRNKRRDAAKSRWSKPADTNGFNEPDKSDDYKPDALAMQVQCKCNAIKEKKENEKKRNESKGKDKPSISPFETFSADDTELRQAFADFTAMRTRIKKPLTNRAQQLIVDKLVDLSGGDRDVQIAILNRSTMSSWAGVFPLQDDGRYNRQQSSVYSSRGAYKASTTDVMGVLSDIVREDGKEAAT